MAIDASSPAPCLSHARKVSVRTSGAPIAMKQGWVGSIVPGAFGNIDQRILGRSIAAEVALHHREVGQVIYENAAMKKLAAGVQG